LQKGRNQKRESTIGRERQKSLRRNFPLIPSQVLVKSNSLKISATTVVQDGDACSEKQYMQVKPTTKRKRKRKRSNKKKKISPLRSNPTTGNFPDIFSGAIPMDHLRHHPNYRPLPENVSNIRCLEDVRFFRQDSWQWDALHNGRTTTSQAAAALGFLEDHAADVLGIPSSWRKGGTGTFVRLRQPALRTFKDMKRVLLVDAATPVRKMDEDAASSVWILSSNDGNHTYAAEYQAQNTMHAILNKESCSKILAERTTR
jgi:hypothetical protein